MDFKRPPNITRGRAETYILYPEELLKKVHIKVHEGSLCVFSASFLKEAIFLKKREKKNDYRAFTLSSAAEVSAPSEKYPPISIIGSPLITRELVKNKLACLFQPSLNYKSFS